MTRAAGSASAAAMAAASSSRRAGVMVLYSRARFRTLEQTPSAVSVRSVCMRHASPAGRGAVNCDDFGYGILSHPMRSSPRLPLHALAVILLIGPRPLLAMPLGDGHTMDGAAELESGKVALDQTDEKLDSRLRQVRGLRASGPLRAGPLRPPHWRRNGQVRVVVRVGNLDPATREALERAGLSLQHENAEDGLVEGWVAAGGVRAVAAVEGVRSVRPAERGETRVVGSGDAASRANLVRALRGFTGAGVRVGVISNGIDEKGDLPAVTVPPGASAGGG